MKRPAFIRWAICIAIVLAFGALYAIKANNEGESPNTQYIDATEAVVSPITLTKGIPAIIDLGSDTCIPCKEMKPILDALIVEYEGKADIQIIDVNENPKAAQSTGIHLIPTQIFYDADGNEVGRHEGFMPREDLVAQLNAMGVE